MFGKFVNSVVAYPPAGDPMRHEVGRSDVTKIELQLDQWSGACKGVKVHFSSGLVKGYCGMAFQYDLVRKGGCP